MAITVENIINNIVSQLKALDPAISCEVGTPERKIIEAVAEQIASAGSDLEVLDSQHDLDTMTGNRLDSFLSVFAFGRQQPTRAVGSVSMSRTTAATEEITIPRGVQVVARTEVSGFAAINFVTVETVTLPVGATSVDARIEAVIPGSLSNVPANSVTGFVGVQAVPGISSVTNTKAITGGIDGEDDASFKIRFKNTVFRNISGTSDQFLALAVSTAFTSKANVVGPISRYQEYVQVPEGGLTADYTPISSGGEDDNVQIDAIIDPTGTRFPHKRTSACSTNPYSKWTYNNQYYLSNGKVGADSVFYRENVDYVFNNPRKADGDSVGDTAGLEAFTPNLTFLDIYHPTENPGGVFTPGDVLLFEHAYMSEASRNEYNNRIMNAVDVFIDGQNRVSVSSMESMPGSAMDVLESPYTAFTYRHNFQRKIDGSPPGQGNRLQVLFWQPLVDVPDSITIGTNRYYRANFYNSDDGEYYNDEAYTQLAHYWLIEEHTNLRGTIRARNGIEWSATEYGIPIDVTPDNPGTPKIATEWAGTQFLLENYFYDANVSDLQTIMENNKQITTDVLVHQAKVRYFKLFITIMYGAGVNTAVVDSNIASSLSDFFNRQYFGTVIQMSDLLQVVHNTPGVDNVRWSSELDGALHKVEEVQQNGRSLNPVVYYDGDFFLEDSELPGLPAVTTNDVSTAVVIRRRAQNTWNSV